MNELERHEGAGTAGKTTSPNPTGNAGGTSAAPKRPETGAQASGAGDNAKSAQDNAKGAQNNVQDTVKEAGEAAQETLKSVRRRASDVYDDAADAARESYRTVTRGAARMRRNAPNSPGQAGRMVSSYIEENPIMVGVLGLAAGLILGSIIPGTRRENEVFGRYADDVKDQGLRYARDLAEQGKHYVEEGLQAAREGAERA
jgi:ElaB/YqjD/DUF883 family membrane-anchored ribosome-binding protein